MVLAIDCVAETVSLTARPSYQQTTVYSHVDVGGHRRHKEEVKFRPVLTPVKYADTAYVIINNTRRRFVSRTFYEPRVQARCFADTTYASPSIPRETYVSYLVRHPDQLKKCFKTTVEIRPMNFTSSASYPDIASVPSNRDVNGNGNSPTAYNHYVDDNNRRGNSRFSPFRDGVSLNSNDNNGDSQDVDENMNRTIPPVFREKYDPGASQVYIPKRKDNVTGVDLLNGISDQILNYNYSNGPDFPNGHMHTPSNGLPPDVSNF